MPVCHCHSFDSLETPLLSHREVFELVTISALELTSTGTKRTEKERTVIHNRLMKLQEDLLRRMMPYELGQLQNTRLGGVPIA